MRHLLARKSLWNNLANALAVTLALGFACWWFFPRRTELPGWGDDPAFVLWTYRVVWSKLNALGPFAIFSREFWDAHIFYPTPWTLALSDNLIYAGILSWPIQKALGNPVQAVNLFNLVLDLAAFCFTVLWLRSIGIRKLATWGGLLISACGWLQSQYSHNQNICLFLFPMALWLWNRYRLRPGWRRAAVCGLGFGWIIGFNLYYQVFANLILAALIVRELSRSRARWRELALIGMLAAAVEFPLAYPYLALEKLQSSYGVGDQEFMGFAARAWSFLIRVHQESWVGRLLPIYPAPETNLEVVGFTGYTWAALCLWAGLRRRDLRGWLAVGAFFYLASLGPKFGVMYPLKLFPGFAALRAIGRLQFLAFLFTVPAVLSFLEALKKAWLPPVLLGLVVLELIPAHGPSLVSFAPQLGEVSATAPFIEAFHPAPATPFLTYPQIDTRLQLALAGTPASFYLGYSGRETSVALLARELMARSLSRHEDLELLRQFLPFERMLTTDERAGAVLKSIPWLRPLGCAALLDLRPCVFEVRAPLPEKDRPVLLELDRDATWESHDSPGNHVALLKARRSGILDSARLNGCALEETLKIPLLPAFHQKRGLPVTYFHGVTYREGEVIFEKISKQRFLDLPTWIRPIRTYRILCREAQPHAS